MSKKKFMSYDKNFIKKGYAKEILGDIGVKINEKGEFTYDIVENLCNDFDTSITELYDPSNKNNNDNNLLDYLIEDYEKYDISKKINNLLIIEITTDYYMNNIDIITIIYNKNNIHINENIFVDALGTNNSEESWNYLKDIINNKLPKDAKDAIKELFNGNYEYIINEYNRASFYFNEKVAEYIYNILY